MSVGGQGSQRGVGPMRVGGMSGYATWGCAQHAAMYPQPSHTQGSTAGGSSPAQCGAADPPTFGLPSVVIWSPAAPESTVHTHTDPRGFK